MRSILGSQLFGIQVWFEFEKKNVLVVGLVSPTFMFYKNMYSALVEVCTSEDLRSNFYSCSGGPKIRGQKKMCGREKEEIYQPLSVFSKRRICIYVFRIFFWKIISIVKVRFRCIGLQVLSNFLATILYFILIVKFFVIFSICQ